MIRGSCLCGSVTFEVLRAGEHFALCHCHRCKKHSGSAFLAGLLGLEVRFLSGAELIKSYEAPVRAAPPAYRRDFCSRCGTAVPNPVPLPDGEVFMIPAGSLDDEPEVSPRMHVWVDCEASWEQDIQTLPRFTEPEFMLERARGLEGENVSAALRMYEFILDRYGERPDADVVISTAREQVEALRARADLT